MSTNMENLSPAERETLDRPDFRPLLNPDFVENPSRPRWDLRQACADCLYLQSTPFPQPGRRGESNVRRRDVEDFRNTWVRHRLWDVGEPDSVSGYWTVGDRPQGFVAEEAVLLVQYKTFRVCVQTGPIEGQIMFVPPDVFNLGRLLCVVAGVLADDEPRRCRVSTADIWHLLSRYLQEFQGDLLPSIVAYSIFDTQAFQFLIIPEPEELLRGSIERFNEDDDVDDRSHIQEPWTMVNLEDEIVEVDQVTLGAISDFRASSYFAHLELTARGAWMDGQHVLSDRADRAEANVSYNRNG